MIITGMMKKLVHVVRPEHGICALAEVQKELHRRMAVKTVPTALARSGLADG